MTHLLFNAFAQEAALEGRLVKTEFKDIHNGYRY